MRKKKSKKAVIVTVIVAGALVVALMIAGTILRMHTHDMNFAQALRSFAADTFNPQR